MGKFSISQERKGKGEVGFLASRTGKTQSCFRGVSFPSPLFFARTLFLLALPSDRFFRVSKGERERERSRREGRRLLDAGSGSALGGVCDEDKRGLGRFTGLSLRGAWPTFVCLEWGPFSFCLSWGLLRGAQSVVFFFFRFQKLPDVVFPPSLLWDAGSREFRSSQIRRTCWLIC